MKDLIITGGGTGGHVFPGVAVLRALEETIEPPRAVSVIWYGSRRGIERSILEAAGIPYRAIPAGKLRRYLSLRNVADSAGVLLGFLTALFLLAADRPRLVFSKGGYVTVPVVYAAALLRIPVVTHESDSDPGLATRLNARVARRILVSYGATRRYFPVTKQDRVAVTGNPVREDVLHGDAGRFREQFGVPNRRPLIAVLGGSLGARQFNRLLAPILGPLTRAATVCHQRGRQPALEADGPEYFSRPLFGPEYADLLAAADIVVARAGAGTVAELAATRRAAVLIPLSSAGSRGDQLRNAALLGEAGAAVVLDPQRVTPEELLDTIRNLLEHPENRSALAGRIAGFARPAAARDAAAILKEYLVP